MLKAQPFELYSIVTGTIRLDGGAMFGVVPKVLWEKVIDVDQSNRILLTTRTLLAVDREQSRVILTDTGCGTKLGPQQSDRYGVTYDVDAIPAALKSAGLSPEDVTDIVITHLHFDHNGGLTDWDDDPGGRVRLRYPRATHWIHRDHWEYAHRPHDRDRTSFASEDFRPLGDAGVLRFVEGDRPAPPFDGVEWLVSHGHTPGQLLPIFGTGSDAVLFVGDLVPTTLHLRLGWVMAYDTAPPTTITEKEAVYRRCYHEGLRLAFPHDPKLGAVAIDGTVERPNIVQTLLL